MLPVNCGVKCINNSSRENKMSYSQVDPSRIIDGDRWSVSLLVTRTYSLGHTLIAVEEVLGGIRKCEVAHYAPYTPPGLPRASKPELIKAVTSTGIMTKGHVIIKEVQGRRTATVRERLVHRLLLRRGQ